MAIGASSSFTIKGRLDGLNEYTSACRANRYSGAKLKKRNQRRVVEAIRASDVGSYSGRVAVIFTWADAKGKNGRHRDKDNIAFAKKFILDGMVEAGVIKDDSWDDVVSFTDMFIECEPEREHVDVFVSEC